MRKAIQRLAVQFRFGPIFFLALAVIPAVALAEDISPLPNESLLSAILAFVGGLAGGQYVGFLAIAGGVVGLLVVLFRTTIGSNLSGIWTLAVLYGLSALVIVLQGLAAGTPLAELLKNAALMGAVLNSINEILRHTILKPKQTTLLASAATAASKKKK